MHTCGMIVQTKGCLWWGCIDSNGRIGCGGVGGWCRHERCCCKVGTRVGCRCRPVPHFGLRRIRGGVPPSQLTPSVSHPTPCGNSEVEFRGRWVGCVVPCLVHLPCVVRVPIRHPELLLEWGEAETWQLGVCRAPQNHNRNPSCRGQCTCEQL